mgnify:CR=1 FL=1
MSELLILSAIPDVRLVAGVGDYDAGEACVMSLAAAEARLDLES